VSQGSGIPTHLPSRPGREGVRAHRDRGGGSRRIARNPSERGSWRCLKNAAKERSTPARWRSGDPAPGAHGRYRGNHEICAMTGCFSTSSTIRWTSTPGADRGRALGARIAPVARVPAGNCGWQRVPRRGGLASSCRMSIRQRRRTGSRRRCAIRRGHRSVAGGCRISAMPNRARRDLRGDQRRDPRRRHAGNPDRIANARRSPPCPHRLVADRHNDLAMELGIPAASATSASSPLQAVCDAAARRQIRRVGGVADERCCAAISAWRALVLPAAISPSWSPRRASAPRRCAPASDRQGTSSGDGASQLPTATARRQPSAARIL